MSDTPKIWDYPALPGLVTRLRDDLNNKNAVLLFAYNGTGKTRLSMEFKNAGKKDGMGDTLYFNAYTEDLFFWDNDLEGDAERYLQINAASRFFSGFKELALEEKIFTYLERYADFNFKIDYEQWRISFSRGDQDTIKISRGEENIFIWCIFMAICTLVSDEHESYSWVKYIYIDDPISSLDDNNAIAVATDLISILKKIKADVKYLISSHHGLFFNVIWNEFRRSRISYNTYFLYKSSHDEIYFLRKTDETPFFHHISMLCELHIAMENNKIYTHHFNALRSIMEKTAVFFGYKDFSSCIHGIDDEVLYARALNLLSHGKYSVYTPTEMGDDNRKLFKKILTSFLERYQFDLPKLIREESSPSDSSENDKKRTTISLKSHAPTRANRRKRSIIRRKCSGKRGRRISALPVTEK